MKTEAARKASFALAGVAQRLMRAAEPVVAARLAQRTVGRIGQHLEVPERQLGVAQMAQRQPAGQEGRVLAGVVGERARIAHQVVGQLGLAGLERRIGAGAPLLPPAVGLDGDGRLGLGEQDLPGLLVLLLPAQRLRHLHGDAPLGLRLGRQLGDQLARVLGAHEHGQARLGLLLLVGGQQRQHAADVLRRARCARRSSGCR